jgi:hypothetical protein
MRLLALAGAALADAATAQIHGTPQCDATAPLPERVRLVYTVSASRGPFQLEGENELVFARQAGGYTLHSETRSLLYRARQDSRGALEAGVLVPREYREQVQRRAELVTSFDWDRHRVRFSADRPAQATEPLMQDRLSMLIQLGLLARGAPQTKAFEMPVAGGRGVSTYRFESRGRTALTVPAQRFETVRFDRVRESEQDGFEVWLAPQLCWLPVSARYADHRGQVVVNQLREAHFD